MTPPIRRLLFKKTNKILKISIPALNIVKTALIMILYTPSSSFSISHFFENDKNKRNIFRKTNILIHFISPYEKPNFNLNFNVWDKYFNQNSYHKNVNHPYGISNFDFFIFTEEMHKFIAEQLNTSRVPLCINPQSAAFKSFAR